MDSNLYNNYLMNKAIQQGESLTHVEKHIQSMANTIVAKAIVNSLQERSNIITNSLKAYRAIDLGDEQKGMEVIKDIAEDVLDLMDILTEEQDNIRKHVTKEMDYQPIDLIINDNDSGSDT